MHSRACCGLMRSRGYLPDCILNVSCKILRVVAVSVAAGMWGTHVEVQHEYEARAAVCCSIACQAWLAQGLYRELGYYAACYVVSLECLQLLAGCVTAVQSVAAADVLTSLLLSAMLPLCIAVPAGATCPITYWLLQWPAAGSTWDAGQMLCLCATYRG